MSKKINNIWILSEFRDGRLTNVFSELLSKSRILSTDENVMISAIVLGDSIDPFIEKVKETGVDKIYAIEHSKLKNYDCQYYKTAIKSLINNFSPDVVLFGATVIGSELAPTVAASIKTGLAAHCVDITKHDDGEMSFWVPAFGGNVIGEILIPSNNPKMASVKPGILAVDEYNKNPNPEIINFECKELDTDSSFITLNEFVPKDSSKQSLEAADIVICGGRGINSEETWEMLKQVAEKLNASVGYTRCLIDRGLVEDETDMIGTSGKSITPSIYIGIGVSGATHHVCGMSKSKTIININKDSSAKIFDISDYKAVAKGEDVLNALLEKLS